MNPVKKESAYLHLPTYIAGICYHIGTFLSFGLTPVIILRIILPPYLLIIIGSGILISIGCGTGILVKRIVTGKLRHLSSPDDYLSNLLVTLFQVVTFVVIIKGSLFSSYFIFLSLLLLYIPVGKLKHLLYFFAARTQLGNFYGRRGVWPPVNNYKK
jgi:nitrate reductase gamma subunit